MAAGSPNFSSLMMEPAQGLKFELESVWYRNREGYGCPPFRETVCFLWLQCEHNVLCIGHNIISTDTNHAPASSLQEEKLHVFLVTLSQSLFSVVFKTCNEKKSANIHIINIISYLGNANDLDVFASQCVEQHAKLHQSKLLVRHFFSGLLLSENQTVCCHSLRCHVFSFLLDRCVCVRP